MPTLREPSRHTDAPRFPSPRSKNAAAAREALASLHRHRSYLTFYVNGKRVEEHHAQPQQTLLEYLRAKGYTGAKLGCGEGGCGACTVNLTRYENVYDPVTQVQQRKAVHRAVNACLASVCSIDGCHVTTVEGIGSSADPHPIQERVAKLHGTQCGFCTPGIVMALYSTLQGNAEPTLHDVEESFNGNLCRCTGYRPLIDAGKTFAKDKAGCCKAADPPAGRGMVKTSTHSKLNAPLAYEAHTVVHDPAGKHAPPELAAELEQLSRDSLHVNGGRVSWHRPGSMSGFLALKADYPHAKIVGGTTEVRIEAKFKNANYPIMISSAGVPELAELKQLEDGSLYIGGSVTLAQVEGYLKATCEDRNAKTTAAGILRMLKWFASTQVRNVSTFAGNVVTASPIADMNPILVAVNAEIHVQSFGEGVTKVKARDFFTGYRKVAMSPSDVLVAVVVPPNQPHEVVEVFKQSRRREDDISIVTACMRAVLAPGSATVKEFTSGFGGMAPFTKPAAALEKYMTGRLLGADVMTEATRLIGNDFPLPPNVPGGMPAFRMSLAASFFYKFQTILSAAAGLPVDPREASAMTSYMTAEHPATTGEQTFTRDVGELHHTDAVPGRALHEVQKATKRAPVGEPIPHRAALLHSTGEAVYTDDMPDPHRCLHAAAVVSQRATGRFTRIDASAALSLEGVVRFFSARDLPEDRNTWGPAALLDEEFFRAKEVTCSGQLLGIVVAESVEAAHHAARLVTVEWSEEAAPAPVVSIKQAIAEGGERFAHVQRSIVNGDAGAALQGGDDDVVVVEGEVRVGGQEHFYMETNASLAVPGENGELELHCSTQATQKTQQFAAQICGLPNSKVVCRMKRMGGGFGGKETRTAMYSSAVALAAHTLKRPVRINVERDVDMWMTGGRHAFYANYKVGAHRTTGKIVAADVQVYNNAGYSLDLSHAVMDRALFHIENAYKIPNVTVSGKSCYTNSSSNTAFRGFGGPQGMMICEQYMDHLAAALGMDKERLREVNMYREGDVTPYGQVLTHNNLPRLWQECCASADIEARKAAIDAFNASHRWKKRGLSVIPTKYGINSSAAFMMQAGALVHVYQDGTVLVAHGGTEMGQGLHTKVIQIAARALDVDIDDVHISTTATDQVANSTPTAGSTGSDLYGMATLAACEKIAAKLAPLYEALFPNGERPRDHLAQVATKAYFDRVDLSAHGFYATPGCGYDFEKRLPEGVCNSERGTPFNYYTQGVGCSEVEIDVLTGDMRVVRADLIMDQGKSLSPAIDIGQIEGAYMQGLGWCMMEELVWGCDEHQWLQPGQCFTRGPGVYKIPSFNDVPVDFRVTLLDNAPNPKAIHSSKAVGEPPYFTASSAFFAAKNAIAAARKDAGLEGFFPLDSPLTPERIRLACHDPIAAAFTEKIVAQGGSERPALFC